MAKKKEARKPVFLIDVMVNEEKKKYKKLNKKYKELKIKGKKIKEVSEQEVTNCVCMIVSLYHTIEVLKRKNDDSGLKFNYLCEHHKKTSAEERQIIYKLKTSLINWERYIYLSLFFMFACLFFANGN